MKTKYLAIIILAVVFLIVVGGLLIGNTQSDSGDVALNVANNSTNGSVETVGSDSSSDDVSLSDEKSDDGDEGWVWSDQQEDYIKQYTDSQGNQHTIFKSSGDDLEMAENGSVYLNGKDITEEFNQDFN